MIGLFLALALSLSAPPAPPPSAVRPAAPPPVAAGDIHPRPFDATEEEAIAALASWYSDPIEFVRANFGAEPDAWQVDALRAIARDPRVAMSACKGPGKSCTLAWVVWWFLATRVDAQVIAVSITADNLRDNLWKELALWQSKSPFLMRSFEHRAERIVQRERPKTWWCSARAFAQSADSTQQANTLAGFHGQAVMVVLDEAGDMPDGLVVAAEAIFANEGIEAHLVLAANPTSTDGPLYRICSKDAKRWTVIYITGDPEDPKRSPRISPEWAQGMIDDWGRDNDWVRVNVLGRFPKVGERKLLGPDDIASAERREVSEHDIAHEPIVFSLDVGRYGKDPSVLYKRHGAIVYRPHVWRGLDGNQLGDQVAAAIWRSEKEDGRRADYVVVDAGGVGSSPVDRLKALGFEEVLIPVEFGSSPTDPRFADRRSEMWWLMAQAVKQRLCLPSRDGELASELTAPDFAFKVRQRRTVGCLETKDELARRGISSPNKGDALALSFAAPLTPRLRDGLGGASGQQGQSRYHCLTDFDPFASGGANG